MKITKSTFTRRSVALPAGLVIAAAAVFGGVAIGNATKAQPAAVEKPVAYVIPADMPVNAAPTVADPETYDEVLADIAAKKAAADAAAAAQAAADAAAAQAAADTAAKAKAATAHRSTGYAPGQAPAGTPIPTHTVTDPNNAMYGQQEIEDPGMFCASHSGSTVNGVPVCD